MGEYPYGRTDAFAARAARARGLYDLITELTEMNASLPGGRRGHKHTLVLSIGLADEDAELALRFVAAWEEADSASFSVPALVRESGLAESVANIDSRAWLSELATVLDRAEKPLADLFTELMDKLTDQGRLRLDELIGKPPTRCEAMIRFLTEQLAEDSGALVKFVNELQNSEATSARAQIMSQRQAR